MKVALLYTYECIILLLMFDSKLVELLGKYQDVWPVEEVSVGVSFEISKAYAIFLVRALSFPFPLPLSLSRSLFLPLCLVLADPRSHIRSQLLLQHNTCLPAAMYLTMTIG